MLAAIYYYPEAYTTSGPRLMGRNAACESFLIGFLKHSKGTESWAQEQKAEHGKHFAQTIKAQGRTKVVKMVDKSTLSALKDIATVYYPRLALANMLFTGRWWAGWVLQPRTLTRLGVCAILHTTSTLGFGAKNLSN